MKRRLIICYYIVLWLNCYGIFFWRFLGLIGCSLSQLEKPPLVARFLCGEETEEGLDGSTPNFVFNYLA